VGINLELRPIGKQDRHPAPGSCPYYIPSLKRLMQADELPSLLTKHLGCTNNAHNLPDLLSERRAGSHKQEDQPEKDPAALHLHPCHGTSPSRLLCQRCDLSNQLIDYKEHALDHAGLIIYKYNRARKAFGVNISQNKCEIFTFSPGCLPLTNAAGD